MKKRKGQPYATPAAFRRALTDQLAALSRQTIWSLAQLQRQIAYDRLLERLYRADDRWILKGATALIARGLGVRGTLDVDLYRDSPGGDAETSLRAAAAMDLGDWFRFESGAGQPAADLTQGFRVPVRAYVGTSQWVAFHVDLVGPGLSMTGAPEDVRPLARVVIPGVTQHGYRAYPLVDHVADKIVATFALYGEKRRPSTRYKDLVDLVVIARGARLDAARQMVALSSEADRRGVSLPGRFDVPDQSLWSRGYAAEAARSQADLPRTLDEALEEISAFVDPLLQGDASGHWTPELRRWVTRSVGSRVKRATS
jgi:hypothetical protein